MSDVDIAWAAGLFEGEGCFTTANRHRKRPTFHCILQMVDEDVVLKFARIMGVGRVRYNGETSTGKVVVRWEASSPTDFRTVVEMLRPHLGSRRLAKANEILGMMSL